MKVQLFLRWCVALWLLAQWPMAHAAEPAKNFEAQGTGAAQPFDYAQLKGKARALASTLYQAPNLSLYEPLAKLTYDEYNNIRFRGEHALWADEPSDFRIQFFHTGRTFGEVIHMYEVVQGRAREIQYDPAMYTYDRSGLNPSALKGRGGFAGFRLQSVSNWKADVAAFLGASYFRAVGDTRQYGLSARGIAVDTALGRPEEFPRFTSFWFERPARGASAVTIYALLDSPSLTGAYRFIITPGATQTMDIDAALYPRKSIERLGVAPLTSMFFTGENDRRISNEWRPEIHDSDGLSIWTGTGEWLWRALTNPAQLRVNSYLDDNPRGFGLLQRDRVWDHYQDDNVYYDRRPSLWVEPRGSTWGQGSIQLVEIPAADETFDNIVAFWNPKDPVKVGQEMLFSYRLYWGSQMPVSSPLAQAVATRTGIGGIIGQKRTFFSWHFAVDFAGGDLRGLAPGAEVEPVITVSKGSVENATAHFVPDSGVYRALFDVRIADEDVDPIDLRLFLRIRGRPLSETWTYQWTPPSARERKGAMNN